jgi:hypothetical protein
VKQPNRCICTRCPAFTLAKSRELGILVSHTRGAAYLHAYNSRSVITRANSTTLNLEVTRTMRLKMAIPRRVGETSSYSASSHAWKDGEPRVVPPLRRYAARTRSNDQARTARPTHPCHAPVFLRSSKPSLARLLHARSEICYLLA